MKKSKFLIVLLSLMLVLLMSAFVGAVDLIILHTNDIHGRIEIGDGIMGMPYLTSLVEYYRNHYDHVLVMDGGDTIHGRPITDRLEGTSTVATMNYAGYNVMVPGNHDFNFGYERLLELEEEMEFNLVAANVFKDGELLFNPYVVFEVGEYKVGVFGLATSDTYTTTHPQNIVGIEFGDMIEASEKYVDILRNQEQVDLVVALGHVGLTPTRQITAAVEGIDLFVDGHSHSRLPEGVWNYGTLIVQAYEYSKYLGKVEITFNDEISMLASLISAEEAMSRVDPNSTVMEMLEEFRADVRRAIMGF